MAREKKYASLNDPLVAAAVGGLLCYKAWNDALYQFRQIRTKFVTSREHDPKEDDAFALWIKGYALTDAQTAEGYKGNFAAIKAVKLVDDMYGIIATKLDTALDTHPQRKRDDKDTPNWMHPVLRSIQKGKVYESFDEAYNEILLLQQTFPKVAIPGSDSLQLMVYERPKGGKGGVRRYNFKIMPKPDGGWVIKPQNKPLRVIKPARKTVGAFTDRLKTPRKKL